MSARRFFYVTQDSLIIWHLTRSGLTEGDTFRSTDEGFAQFADYLGRSSEQLSTMMIDVIEEEFVSDTVPKLGSRDRKLLIDRRLLRKFPVAPFRVGIFQGRWSDKGDTQEVLLAAVTNHELVDPWLTTIASHKTPLQGVYSVPLLGTELLLSLHHPAENSLFLTQHQGKMLRQLFIKSGKLKSARLSQTPSLNSEDYGSSVFAEVQRSRRYLERKRLLSANDQLNIYMVADEELAKRVLAGVDNQAELKLHFIEPVRAAELSGLPGEPQQNHLESLYLASCAKKVPKYSYKYLNKCNYARLLRLRHAAIAISVSAAVTCSLVSGVLLTSGMLLRNAAEAIESQVGQLQETYRREHAEFQPIRADSHEMKLAVDTGDFILRNSLPIGWVMEQIGKVMGEHSDMRIDGLSWKIDSILDQAASQTARVRNGKPLPVTIPAIAAINANLHGQIRPYDGDLREAFAKIERLASSLESKTAFENVVVSEYPVDLRPQSSVSGKVSGRDDVYTAQFSLRLTLRIQDETGGH